MRAVRLKFFEPQIARPQRGDRLALLGLARRSRRARMLASHSGTVEIGSGGAEQYPARGATGPLSCSAFFSASWMRLMISFQGTA